MAYFDSPKNRAIWEAELSGLKKRKADFASGRLPDQESVHKEFNMEEAHRKPVSYEQLVKEEEASVSRRRGKTDTMERKKERGMERKLETTPPVLRKQN